MRSPWLCAHLRSRRRKGDPDRLDRLRQWRTEADYRDDLIIDLPAAVGAAVAEAEMLFASRRLGRSPVHGGMDKIS